MILVKSMDFQGFGRIEQHIWSMVMVVMDTKMLCKILQNLEISIFGEKSKIFLNCLDLSCKPDTFLGTFRVSRAKRSHRDLFDQRIAPYVLDTMVFKLIIKTHLYMEPNMSAESFNSVPASTCRTNGQDLDIQAEAILYLT